MSTDGISVLWDGTRLSPVSSIHEVPYLTSTKMYNQYFAQTTIYGDVVNVEVLSYPQMSKEDIVSIENDGVIYVDGGKAEAILNVTPHRIRLSAGWYRCS